MPAGTPFLERGPSTYEVNVAVTKGQLVEPDGSTGKVKPATAGSVKVLGVATLTAAPAGSNVDTTLNTPQPYTSVQYGPGDMRVTYSAAATFGALLVCTGVGKVGPYTAGTTTFDAVVGRCTEPAGVASNAVGRARLSL